MTFSRKSLSFVGVLALLMVGGIAAMSMTRRTPLPRYDLLFSVDSNDVPYSDPKSTGIVIRGMNHKARVIFTGKWQAFVGATKPEVYICKAATGTLRGIHIAIRIHNFPNLPDDVDFDNSMLGHPVFIRALELERLTIDDSSTAPNGYSLSDVDFTKAYPVLDLVEEGTPPFFKSRLKNDAYKKCLKQVATSIDGVTVHLIGWIISQQ
jgi:hypothetical protein